MRGATCQQCPVDLASAYSSYLLKCLNTHACSCCTNRNVLPPCGAPRTMAWTEKWAYDPTGQFARARVQYMRWTTSGCKHLRQGLRQSCSMSFRTPPLCASPIAPPSYHEVVVPSPLEPVTQGWGCVYEAPK